MEYDLRRFSPPCIVISHPPAYLPMSEIAQSRVWLITGTSSGFGRALLELVLSKNERAVATARNVSVLDDLRAKYSEEQLLVQHLDVTHVEQIEELFATVEAHFHRLDVVVNNAGYGLVGEIEAIPDDKARHQIETLFWGPVNITKRAIRMFRDVNPPGVGGRVLAVSSVGGYAANATRAYYNAGKFALEGFTEAFTREMPPEWNIKGIIIEPGMFPTEWHAARCARLLRMVDAFPRIGDVARAARVMYDVAGIAEPPLRLQLGSDAWGIVNTRAKATLADQEKWASWSHGTNQDGYGPEVLEMLAEAK
ncbi:hypothetical protein BC834DRAFT_1030792 [Gloeopeniophorella convolvens]|nr:hypothetical protein BC834DRAFT_1030792 [Gloeopeniophorella convolvens]